MGNRAVITTERAFERNGVGIYLHWHGGRDSVEGFLMYCKLKGYASPDYDSASAMARLTQVIANYLGNIHYVEIGCVNQLDCDNGDNGTYIIGGNWEIIDRKYHTGDEQNDYPLHSMLKDINNRMPTMEQFKIR